MSMQYGVPEARHIERAKAKTEILRTSPASEWGDARKRLREAGYSEDQAVLASWEEHDNGHWIGVVCTAEEVFLLGIVYGYDRAWNPAPRSHGWVNSWDRVSQEQVDQKMSNGHPKLYGYCLRLAQHLLRDSEER